MRIDGNTSVSDLYRGDDESELSHAWLKKGEQSDDHKYTSREWKNGRWQYTYATSNNKKTAAITKNTSTAKKPGVIARYISGVKKDVAESKERAVANRTSFAKEYIKDRFGYDEKKQYQVSKEKYDDSVKSHKMMQDWLADIKSDKQKAQKEGRTEDVEKETYYEKLVRGYIGEDQAKAMNAGSEYIKSKNDYMNTPLYKIDKFKEGIDDINSWFEEKLGVHEKRKYDRVVSDTTDVGRDLKFAERFYENDFYGEYGKSMYEEAYKNYEKQLKVLEEARDSYKHTPLGAIDVETRYAEKWREEAKEARIDLLKGELKYNKYLYEEEQLQQLRDEIDELSGRKKRKK